MSSAPEPGRVVGRYVLYDEIASGGMATIHLGRMLGQVGFARTVAIKRLHPHFAKDPEFVAMFIDEARLAAGIQHPNVVSTLDVVAVEGDLFLVMEYVEGDSLSHLVRQVKSQRERIPPAVVSAIVSNVLYGLHAAHVARDDRGAALNIVHRDISPQNVLVGVDGVARVVDFGVAKASRRIMETEAGRIKGKFRYMAPEQIRADQFDHRVDIFAAGIVLWEALTSRALFHAEEPMRVMSMVLDHPIALPSSIVPELSAAVDAVVMKALERAPEARYQSARELAIDLENALPPAVPRVVGEWVESLVGEVLRTRAARLIELGSESGAAAPTLSDSSIAVSIAADVQHAADSAAARARVPQASQADVLQSAPAHPVVDVPPAPTFLPTPFAQPAQVSSSPFTAEPPVTPSSPYQSPLQGPPSHTPAPGFAPVAPGMPGGPPVEPSSQISEVSTAAWDTEAQRSLLPAPQMRQVKVALASIAASLFLFLVVLLVFLRVRSGRDEAPDVQGLSPANAATPAVGPKATAPPTPPAATPAPAESAPAPPPVAEPSAEPEKPKKPEPVAEKEPVAPKPTKPSVNPVPKLPAAPANDCNPPWVIENGIKKFKRHCI
ncbi:MAG: protein kinase [Myxococcales bacterium]|nr:protein kinase [Myxococcales bacterium]